MDSIKPSVGVELEFLVCVAVSGQPLNVPRRFENSNGRPVCVPAGVSVIIAGRDEVEDRIKRTIKSTLSQHRGSRVLKLEDPENLLDDQLETDSLHLRYYRDWSVDTDPSVILAPNDEVYNEAHITEYHWHSVEIASPALWATDESWEEIQAVVEALHNEFWIITPTTAGMHYHFGNGKEYIPFSKLRRIAAFLVAVDPIIVQLHPESRRANGFCRSNRLYSRVAHGRPAAIASREIGAEYIEEEPEFPGIRPQPVPVSRPFYKRTVDFVAPFKRGQLTGYEFFAETFFDTGYAEDRDIASRFPDGNYSTVRPLDIPFAVREILRCVNAPTVTELMRYGPSSVDRPAYSFLAYTKGRYRRLIHLGNQVDRRDQHKRTIEFRQMAPTMEADEVVAHGKVIVRLCQFAAEADLEEFWKVVLDCTVAEVSGDWFDVFDLLAELGLTAEARVLQDPVARFRGDVIPEELEDDGEEENIQVAAEREDRRSWWRKLLRWRLAEEPVTKA
ncbi:hypothetical protein O1611_g2616 [Lasiodiplodia mahajangana]|uniref:Uncharacterized protein n=1 Tax=Lasiodiplodia mahajangana TaxID=1108764 RepID=A0ACC2JU07_9PEZI|nr:hypothetical protein O1611_g2616 [Lasiodiplodia mahajangana]